METSVKSCIFPLKKSSVMTAVADSLDAVVASPPGVIVHCCNTRTHMSIGPTRQANGGRSVQRLAFQA